MTNLNTAPTLTVTEQSIGDETTSHFGVDLLIKYGYGVEEVVGPDGRTTVVDTEPLYTD